MKTNDEQKYLPVMNLDVPLETVLKYVIKENRGLRAEIVALKQKLNNKEQAIEQFKK